MSRDQNYLLGEGERLTQKVKVPKGGAKKNPPYEFSTAKRRISKKISAAATEFASVPKEAAPKDEVVAVLTMHPRYISKSEYPEELLKSVGLRSIGSKSATIVPEKWGIKSHPETAATEQLFVAGKRNSFEKWATEMRTWSDNSIHSQIMTIEDLSAYKAKDKIKQIMSLSDELTLEVVLHNSHDQEIVEAFRKYVEKLNAKPLMDRRRDVRGLTFLPVQCHKSLVEAIAQFSFLRVLRGMPQLRPLIQQVIRSTAAFGVTLPPGPAINQNIRAAIFDGGVPSTIGLNQWVTPIDPPGIGKPDPGSIAHGVGVTSAFLFGHITDPVLNKPFCNVDHVRVLDDQTGKTNDLAILDVLDRILNHLDANADKYKFVNLSLGPNLPISDDEVTAWTASVDERLCKSDILTTVAVGNYGHYDAMTGLNRILPPSDGVNVLAVGSCDKTDSTWQRAFYSCVGPGRRPGLVKPDGLAFGGSEQEPFVMLAPTTIPTARADAGTSFSAPFTLRTSAGVATYLGQKVSSRVLRALMIHRAQDQGLSKIDVGWGRFQHDINDLITCSDDEALVIYQGELPVGEHLRSSIPLPDGPLKGNVFLTATLVISPDIDPEHPGAYTRSGLEVFFRPHSDKFRKTKDGKQPKHQKTQPFFSIKNMYGKAEYEFREDGSKWEPCIRNVQKVKASSLKEPCFDIYYHHREGAVSAENPKPIPYALVISMKAPSIPDFYDRMVRTYANVLVPLKPQVQVQVRV